MTLGTKMQRRWDRVFNNRNIRSSITITPITKTEGSYGGYESVTETEGTAVSTYCIPYDYFKSKHLDLRMGTFNSGDVGIVIKGTETITKDYKVTWNGDTYEVEDIQQRIIADTVVAQVVGLSKVTS